MSFNRLKTAGRALANIWTLAVVAILSSLVFFFLASGIEESLGNQFFLVILGVSCIAGYLAAVLPDPLAKTAASRIISYDFSDDALNMFGGSYQVDDPMRPWIVVKQELGMRAVAFKTQEEALAFVDYAMQKERGDFIERLYVVAQLTVIWNRSTITRPSDIDEPLEDGEPSEVSFYFPSKVYQKES